MGSSTPLEPFPTASSPIEMVNVPNDQTNDSDNTNVDNTPLSLSNTVGQERRESVATSPSRSAESITRRLSRSFQESDLPRGFLAATADMTSSMVAASRPPSRSITRTRSSTVSDPDERSRPLQQQRTISKGGDSALATLSTLDEHKHADDAHRTSVNSRAPTAVGKDGASGAAIATGDGTTDSGYADDGPDPANADLFNEYDNGYHFPPRYSTSESFQHGMRAFWHYVKTPTGFLVVLYGCNVVAWGGMLFLLLCNASPAMCYPTCNNINSPRRKWIEWDSQIINALFCVTGFGLAPWRFRDMYFYLQFWIGKNQQGLRRLAGVHRGWIRLEGSENLPVTTGPGNIPPETPAYAIPYPETKIPDAPLTGRRAPPTKLWRIAFILVMNISNTFLQAVLCGFMWGMNRYKRPSWSTGLFVALGCIAGAVGGLGMFVEGKRVKGIEGVPLTDEDRQKLARDREQGIYHYNNLKGKKPKEKPADVEAGK